MKKGRGRYIFCGVMLAAVFLLYIGRLAQWQLLEGSTFEEEAVQSSATYLKLTGTRGEILDCNGNVLAGNRSVYNAIYSRLSGSNETRNAVVLEAVKLLETLNVPWTDRLPIEIKSGKYQFKTKMTAEIETLKSEDNCHLHNVRHQIIRNSIRTFPKQTALMRSNRIKVT